MKRSGFSLLELCIVIGLLAIIIHISMSGFAAYDRLLVHQELDRLYMLFIMLSRKALLQNEPIELSFKEKKLVQGVQCAVIPTLQGPPSTPHALSEPITFKEKKVVFSPDGKIQAGALYLTDTHKRWQYALTVGVGHVSYIRRYRYDHPRWVLLS
jgi:type II secretory pathway pseudopilin PulG